MKVLSNIQNNEDAVTKEYVDAKTGISAVDPTSGSIETDFFIPTKTSELTNDSGFITSAALTGKQDTLVSGTNIKTINNQSLLGSGNLTISGGTATDVQINSTSITSSGTADIKAEGTYNASTNKLTTKNYVANQLGNYVKQDTNEGDYYMYIEPMAVGDNGYGLMMQSFSDTGSGDTMCGLEISSYYDEDDDENKSKIWLYSGESEITLDGYGIKITGVITPTDNYDAATKKYVDDAIAAAITDALEASY